LFQGGTMEGGTNAKGIGTFLGVSLMRRSTLCCGKP